MSTDDYDAARADKLCRPITMAEAMRRTGRSKRTIDRWIVDGHLRRVQLDQDVVLVEREIVEYDKRMRDNLKASRGITSWTPPNVAT